MFSSVAFPLITVSGGQNIIPTLNNSVVATWLPEIVIVGSGPSSATSTPISYWSWIIPVYLVVASIMLIILLLRISRIIILHYHAKRYKWQTYTVAESSQVKGIFSFFNFIFIQGNDPIDETEKEEILQHEAVHIRKGHSFDIVFVHVLQTLCWFNPIIWFYKKSLVQVHEFEADARSVENMDVNRYCGLLAKVALQQNGFVLANHFTNSFTLKRINMMKKVRRKISQWKIVTAVLMLAAYFVVVACQDQVMSDIKEITQNSTISLDYPIEVHQELEKARLGMPGTEFYVLEMNEEGVKKMNQLIEELQSTGLEGRTIIVNEDGQERSFYIYRKEGQAKRINALSATEDGVFTIVEETAEPIDGMEKFYEYIAANLKYPQEAQSKGIEGRVFIEFIVNTDGSISDLTAIKGIGAGCDQEAIRVLASAPLWKPGMQNKKEVRQRMVVPIVFRL
jgi:TonB family protein